MVNGVRGMVVLFSLLGMTAYACDMDAVRRAHQGAAMARAMRDRDAARYEVYDRVMHDQMRKVLRFSQLGCVLPAGDPDYVLLRHRDDPDHSS